MLVGTLPVQEAMERAVTISLRGKVVSSKGLFCVMGIYLFFNSVFNAFLRSSTNEKLFLKRN